MMEDLLACRVCLATDVNLFDMYRYRLKHIYETICGVQMSPADNYPQYLCSFCSTLLLKCVSFRERSRRSQELMKYAEMKTQILTTAQIHTIAVSHHTTLSFTISTPEITTITDIPVKTEKPPTAEPEIVKEEVIADQSDEEPLSKKVKKKPKRTIEVEIEIEPFHGDEETSVDTLDTIDFDAKLPDNEHDENNDDNEENDSEFSSNEIEVIFLTKEQQIQELQARKESYNYLNSFYKCDHCYKGFIQDITYKNHMARHDPSLGKIICDICNTRWPTPRSLRSHCVTAHERKYICKICNQVLKSSFRAKEHLKWHKGVKFLCKICGASFEKSTSYLTHLRMQHPTKYCCDVCGERFLGETGLSMHKKKKHRGFEKLKRVEFQCSVCSVKFKSMDALKRHRNLFKNRVCDSSLCSCFQCGENLPTQDSLRDHLKTHEVAVRCEECNRNFAHKRSFSVHYQRVHLGRKHKHYKTKDNNLKTSCVCEVCGKKCISNTALIYHQRIHTGEKPFQCSECPKKFSIFQRLQIHLRTHTGERPYKCSHCPKAFKHKAALNRHDRVHTGAKPYECAHCGKTFSQSNSMKIHVRTVHLKMPAPYRARRNNKNIDDCEQL